VHDRRDALRLRKARPRLRVDVDAKLVRLLRVAAPRRPCTELERREVGRPDDVRELGHAQLVRVTPRRERDARRLDPFGPTFRHALLPDHLAPGAGRLPLQLARPLVQRAHDPIADGHEVPHEVELGLAACRKVDLVRVGDLDRAAADVELDERRRHSAEYRLNRA